MTAQSELDSSTGDHIPKTILAPIHLSLQGKQKLYAIIHGLLYVMYDHTICFLKYYIYIYTVYTCFASSNRRSFRTLTLNLFEVSFSSGQVLLWGGRTHVTHPPLPPFGRTDPMAWRPVSTVKNQVVNTSCSPGGFNKVK